MAGEVERLERFEKKGLKSGKNAGMGGIKRVD
jgi:hypothetical protein